MYIIALAYVDDLLLVSSEQSGVEYVHQSLAALLKVKVTGKLRMDGSNSSYNSPRRTQHALRVKPEYVRSVFSAFGWTDKEGQAHLHDPRHWSLVRRGGPRVPVETTHVRSGWEV